MEPWSSLQTFSYYSRVMVVVRLPSWVFLWWWKKAKEMKDTAPGIVCLWLCDTGALHCHVYHHDGTESALWMPVLYVAQLNTQDKTSSCALHGNQIMLPPTLAESPLYVIIESHDPIHQSNYKIYLIVHWRNISYTCLKTTYTLHGGRYKLVVWCDSFSTFL